MLDIKLLRQNPEVVDRGLKRRGLAAPLEHFLRLDARRRNLLTEVERLKNKRNVVSEEIGKLKKAGQEPVELIAKMREVSQRMKALDEEIRAVEEELEKEMLTLPNLPHPSVPDGSGETDNVVVRTWGEKPSFSFTPRPHREIGEELGIIDFERGSKVAGARFVFYRGAGARLERALINFMLDLHIENMVIQKYFLPSW